MTSNPSQILVIVILFLAVQSTVTTSKISTHVMSKIEAGHSVDIFIRMVNGTSDVLDNLNQQTFATRAERHNAVAKGLKDYAEECQSSILRLLETLSDVEYHQCYWITNEIFVKNASPHLIKVLSTSRSVHEIHEDKIIVLDEPINLEVDPDPTVTVSADNPQPGIKMIQAPNVWKQLDTKGEGVIVGGIDTGVRGSHEALRNKFVGGDHGWFDPAKKTKSPNDNVGHGTHTMGTIVGGLGIGVAPGAKWMACKGCRTTSCTQSDLTQCAQFMLCPTMADGTASDCSLAPHLISNSWGAGQGEIFFDKFIQAWHASGIIPIFSIGNSGPECGSANSPGDSNAGVISVGAIGSDNKLASFSSTGPSTSGAMKPDICAPGVGIRSAYYRSDTDYAVVDGTSMAAPHVSGTVALLKSVDLNLSFKDALAYITSQADDDGLKKTSQQCEGPGNKNGQMSFPNNAYGYGRLNAFRAVKELASKSASPNVATT